MTHDFATRCRTAQECIPQGAPYRDRLTALHDAMLVRIAELEAELVVTDKLLEGRNRVMRAIPACEAHGDQCVPHALDWVSDTLVRIAELETENERLRADVAALLTENLSGVGLRYYKIETPEGHHERHQIRYDESTGRHHPCAE